MYFVKYCKSLNNFAKVFLNYSVINEVIIKKETMMIQSIGAIGSNFCKVDQEYTRIMMELHKLGLTPTGNKEVDKATLEAEKQKLAQKIQEKSESQTPEKNNNTDRAILEEKKLGAMQVAELNKILHGLS